MHLNTLNSKFIKSGFLLKIHNNFQLCFRNREGIKELHVDFIPIFVYDEELRNYVRNNLERLDCVRVEGVLKYKNEKNEEGKPWKGGYISTKKIVKMVSAHKLVKNQKDRSLDGLKVKMEINRRSNNDNVEKKS